MKARNKITGREITILGISKEWGTVSYIADGVLHQENFSSGVLEIIDDSDPVDWPSFRREAAKDAMCQLIGMGRDDGYKYSPEEVVRYAIVYADELIKQLKQE